LTIVFTDSDGIIEYEASQVIPVNISVGFYLNQ